MTEGSPSSPDEEHNVVCTFHMVASAQRRLFARILQVLENQQVVIHSFSGMVKDEGCFVTVTIESQDDLRYRIESLLYRLQDVHSVSVAADTN
jgi:hypothetical protein